MTHGNLIDLVIIVLNSITAMLAVFYFTGRKEHHPLRRIGSAIVVIGLLFQVYISGHRYFSLITPDIWFLWSLKDIGLFVLAIGLVRQGRN